ncbi:MAG: hypothetical protein ACO265_08750 [Polynucleobacter sp.]
MSRTSYNRPDEWCVAAVLSLGLPMNALWATGGYLRTDYVRGTFEAMLSWTD